jgi:hypothetical protein
VPGPSSLSNRAQVLVCDRPYVCVCVCQVTLGPFPRYTVVRFAVSSTTAVGESGMSTVLSTSTLATVPSPVRDVALVPEWTNPITLVRPCCLT